MEHWSAIPGAMQFEDALLFVWLVFVTPLLQFILGGALSGLDLGNLDRAAPNAFVLGAALIFSSLLAIACMLTRSASDRQAEEMISSSPFGYAHLPMMAGTGILLFLGLDLVGWGDAAMGSLCLLFAAFVVIGVVYKRMPVIDNTFRRILMTPFSIITATLFVSTIRTMFSGVNANGVFQLIQNDLGRFELGLLLGGVLVYYLMFVFAPRQMAGAGGTWLQWGARFALYLVSVVLNIRLLQVV